MEMKEEVRVEGFEGPWWRHPPMRNALTAGVLTGTAFLLGHIGAIGPFVEIPLYIIAIILGGFHWAREGIEELIEEREIGIEILMIGATIGSAVLGMWDEAAFLVFLYGTAEGLEEYAYAKARHSIRELLDLAIQRGPGHEGWKGSDHTRRKPDHRGCIYYKTGGDHCHGWAYH